MEFLILFAIGFLIRGSLEHSKGDRARSRDQRVKEVAKTHPKGSLNKSQQKAAARRHATGWWAREIRHGFPVHRTGWHAAWLAHQTTADHHKARREEARTTALETRASVLAGMPDHKKRQAEAQKELDAIEAELAAQQAKGSPATGKSAVQSAADEVARKRREKLVVTDTCPSCGAPDGYDHLAGCALAAPPLPADSVRPAEPVVIDTPVRVHNAEDSAHLRPGQPRCDGCGGSGRNADGNDACPVCRGWGSGPPDPLSPLAADDAVCTTCGNTGKPGDPVLADPGGNIHMSHATEQQEAYWDRLNRDKRDEHEKRHPVAARNPQPISPTASPTTQGAPVSDTNYTAVLAHADQAVINADQDAVTAAKRRQTAEQHAEGMQAANVQGTCLTAQMELTELHKKVEEATKAAAEQATLVSDSLKKEHGGIQAAVDDAPIAQPAEPAFYGGS